MSAPTIVIEKHWDGNETVTERNNRAYVSRGRWQWVVVVDDVTESAHDRKRDAVARVEELRNPRPVALWPVIARLDGATVSHVVMIPSTRFVAAFEVALCGERPGRTSSGWDEVEAEVPSCPRCRAEGDKLTNGGRS